METERLSYCRICAAACGIVVTTDEQQVIRVRGDAEHPVSRGYVCSKGRGLPAWHHHPSRLDRPRLRGVEVTWDALLDDLGSNMRETIDAHGSSAIALYLATGLAYDSAGQVAAGQWMGAIGSSSFYTAATVDNAPVLVAAELVAGNAMLNPVWDPTTPGLLVLIATNPVVAHGYGTTLPDPVRHLRDFRRGGGTIWVVDPRRTESAALAGEHLAVRPGADVALLAALVRELLIDGADPDELCAQNDLAALRTAVEPFTIERAAAVADVDEVAIRRLLADIREHRGHVAIFCGTGTTMATDGVVTEWLRWVLLVLTGSLDRPGGMRFNRGLVNRLRPPAANAAATLPGPASRPDLGRVAGQVPAVALVDEIEAGHVRTLVVTGGNPLSALPEPDRVRRAFAMLDALVVLDVMDGELCELATHVLPATGQLERADLSLAEHVALRSGLQSTLAVVDPVAERRPVWWMLSALSQRLGVTFLGGAPADSMDDETILRSLLARSPVDADTVFAAGPHGVDAPPEFGRVRAEMLPNGVWQIAPSSMLARLAAHREPPTTGLVVTPRREMAWSNSIRYAGVGAEAMLRLHAEDASAAGLADGDTTTIDSEHGAVEATVTIDANARRGVASLTHGRAGSSPGVLTSSRAGVDPITAMPHASGLPISIRRSVVQT